MKEDAMNTETQKQKVEMVRYCGVEVIHARPMTIEEYRALPDHPDNYPDSDGYLLYCGGENLRWCPKKEFDLTYKSFDEMDMSSALGLLEAGVVIERKAWGGHKHLVLDKDTGMFMEVTDESTAVWLPSPLDLQAADWMVNDDKTHSSNETVCADVDKSVAEYMSNCYPELQVVEEQAIEKRIGAVFVAPRVTPGIIDALIVSEQFHVFPGTSVTICLLTLKNGFSVRGESSCISIENFDPSIGRDIARRKAREKIWQLEGYLLCEKLSKGE